MAFLPGFRSKLDSLSVFCVLALCLIGAATVRSACATSLDGPLSDERWHALAGVSYVQRADYRLNPEHPPLVKLWVGALLAEARLPPFPALEGKDGERSYIETAYFQHNDRHALHARMRLAMLAFHALAMLALSLSLRRLVGAPLALATTGLLLLDPTVAAHMPVVLTDLPLAIGAAIAASWALIAFRSWRALDLCIAGLTLGAALACKHSALPLLLFVAGLGVGLAAWERPGARQVVVRLACVAGVLLAAYGVLWSSYGFRFAEAPAGITEPTFNRPYADKLEDLHSPAQRALLQVAHDYALLPRAYLWGLADTLRAGLDGRQFEISVFARFFFGETPWYFFPVQLLIKPALGWLGLVAVGAWLLARRRVPERVPETWRAPVLGMLCWGAFYMLVLARGNSGYAGVRHALPVFPVLALVAAVALVELRASARGLQWISGALLLWACFAVLPQRRPWEYYNELAGGPSEAWRSFSDDGLEPGLRVHELLTYYDANVRGRGQQAYDFYLVPGHEQEAYDLRWHRVEDDALDDDLVSGVVFLNTRYLLQRPYYDFDAFRDAEPVARMGNLLVLRGTFRLSWLPALRRRYLKDEAVQAGDYARAEQLLAEIVHSHPYDYESAFDLANLLLRRGAYERAIAAYTHARKHSPERALNARLSRQIEVLRSDASSALPLTSPWDD